MGEGMLYCPYTCDRYGGRYALLFRFTYGYVKGWIYFVLSYSRTATYRRRFTLCCHIHVRLRKGVGSLCAVIFTYGYVKAWVYFVLSYSRMAT